MSELERLQAAMKWLEDYMFDRHWDGTIGRPSIWRMAGPYRHDLNKMRGETLLDAIESVSKNNGEE